MRLRNRLLLTISLLLFANYSIGDDNEETNSVFGTDTFLDSGTSFLDEFRWLIESGRLSSARRKALEELQNPSPNRFEKDEIAKLYADIFQNSYDAGGDEYLQKIRNSLNEPTVRAKDDSPNCVRTHSDWTAFDPYELWDKSCSILTHQVDEAIIDSSFLSSSRLNSFSSSLFQEQCCIFTQGSWTYLRIPAIFEPAIQVGIRQSYDIDISNKNSSLTFLNLEQDGYLRPYDVAGILWPTGYMLSLCLGNIRGCPIPELHDLIRDYQTDFVTGQTSHPNEILQNYPLALELGTGIGASSIALAKSLEKPGFPSSSSHTPHKNPWVVATDFAPYALALTIANAKSNNAFVGTAIMDHFNRSSLIEINQRFFSQKIEKKHAQISNERHRDGFSLIFGSSLQGLFRDTDRSDSPLWKAIDELLDTNDPNSLVILAHNREDLQNIPSDCPYQLVRQLLATDPFFGNMKNRAGDLEADFLLSVLKPSIYKMDTITMNE